MNEPFSASKLNCLQQFDEQECAQFLRDSHVGKKAIDMMLARTAFVKAAASIKEEQVPLTASEIAGFVIHFQNRLTNGTDYSKILDVYKELKTKLVTLVQEDKPTTRLIKMDTKNTKTGLNLEEKDIEMFQETLTSTKESLEKNK